MSFTADLGDIVARNDSGVLAINPAWGRIELGRVAKIRNGYPFDSKRFSKTSGTPLIRIRDILSDHTDCYYEGEVPEGYWVDQGDILVGMDGDFNVSNWRGARALLNQRVCTISVDEQVYDARFLRHALPGYLKAINAHTSSITVKHLSSRTLAQIPLPFPPLAEQRRIAEKLDRLLASVDASKARLRKMPAILKRFRQSVLAFAISGELTEEWRGQFVPRESGRVLAENMRVRHTAYANRPDAGQRRPHVDRNKDYDGADVIALTEMLPPSWGVGLGADVVEPGAEIVYGIVQPGEKLTVGVPYVRGMDIENGRILVAQLLKTSPEIAARYARASIMGGDVLLGIIRATKVAIVPNELDGANITQGTARFRPWFGVRSRYLALALEAPDTQKWLHRHYRGIDMPGLNLSDVRRVPIPIPPLDEQDAIVGRVETLMNLATGVEARHEVARVSVARLAASLLERAFKGELSPQDPNDEPAHTTLKRVRAESVIPVRRTKSSDMSRRKEMPTSSPESLKEIIQRLPAREFGFDDLRAISHSDYESLKDMVFTLLADSTSGLRQVFDEAAGEIRFHRTAP